MGEGGWRQKTTSNTTSTSHNCPLHTPLLIKSHNTPVSVGMCVSVFAGDLGQSQRRRRYRPIRKGIRSKDTAAVFSAWLSAFGSDCLSHTVSLIKASTEPRHVSLYLLRIHIHTKNTESSTLEQSRHKYITNISFIAGAVFCLYFLVSFCIKAHDLCIVKAEKTAPEVKTPHGFLHRD